MWTLHIVESVIFIPCINNYISCYKGVMMIHFSQNNLIVAFPIDISSLEQPVTAIAVLSSSLGDGRVLPVVDRVRVLRFFVVLPFYTNNPNIRTTLPFDFVSFYFSFIYYISCNLIIYVIKIEWLTSACLIHVVD